MAAGRAACLSRTALDAALRLSSGLSGGQTSDLVDICVRTTYPQLLLTVITQIGIRKGGE